MKAALILFPVVLGLSGWSGGIERCNGDESGASPARGSGPALERAHGWGSVS
jgi:hypothetical protein